MAKVHTTLFRACPFDGAVPLIQRALPLRAARFAIDQLLSMDEACAKRSGPIVALGSPSAAIGGGLRDAKLTPYPDEDDRGDFFFADVHADPSVDILDSLRRDLDTIHELCRSAKVDRGRWRRL